MRPKARLKWLAFLLIIVGLVGTLSIYRMRLQKQFAEHSALSKSLSQPLAEGDTGTPGTTYVRIPGRTGLYPANSQAGMHAEKAAEFQRTIRLIDLVLVALVILASLAAVLVSLFRLLAQRKSRRAEAVVLERTDVKSSAGDAQAG